MNITFRLADLNDLVAIHDIRRDAILGSDLADMSAADRQEWADRRSPEFFTPRVAEGTLVIVESESGPIAWGSSTGNHITGIYVRSSEHRTGVGRKLMAKLESDIAERGYATAELVSSPNAIEFYIKVGYIAVHPPVKDKAVPMDKVLGKLQPS